MNVDGVELATKVIAGVGPTVVWLHEGLGSIGQWRDVPDRVAAASGLPALIYDREGHGASTAILPPRPLTYMHDEAARLPRVLAAAGIADSILVGHSDGASIAIIAAGQGLVQPRAMVLLAPHVFVEDLAVSSITAAKVAFETTDMRARLAKYHADVDGMFWGWNRAWLDPDFRRWNLEGFLPRIECPLLVIQGDADEYGTLAQVDAIVRGVRPGLVDTFVVPGAKHAPQRDARDAVLARIAAFLARVAPRAGVD